MDAQSVRTRHDLESYLGKALIDEYYLREEGRITRQVSTFLKTFLLDLHGPDDSPVDALTSEGSPFRTIGQTAEPSMWRFVDSAGANYFLDALDRRFPLLHTIENTKHVNPTMRKLSGLTGVDSVWLPSRMLRQQRLGRIIGFRLFHQPGLSGLEATPSARQLARELGKREPPPIRVAVTDYGHAQRDLDRLQTETEFGGRSALDSLSWTLSEGEEGGFIHDEVWFDGRVTGKGTSWPMHLSNVLQLRDGYMAFIDAVESSRSIRSDRGVLEGEPILVEFERPAVSHLSELAEAIANPSSGMRLWGSVSRVDTDYLAIDAVDLHTGHRLSIDLTDGALRIYLRHETCGNVLPRLLVHLERLIDARMTTSIDSLMETQTTLGNQE